MEIISGEELLTIQPRVTKEFGAREVSENMHEKANNIL